MTVKEAIRRCENIKNEIVNLENEKNKLEDKIKKYMQKKERKKIQCGSIGVRFVQVDKLNYSVDDMKRYLSARMVKRLTDKKYNVDGAALAELANEDPELYSRLRQVITISRVPNKNKIEKAFSSKQLTETDILKFATINSFSYLKYKDENNNE